MPSDHPVVVALGLQEEPSSETRKADPKAAWALAAGGTLVVAGMLYWSLHPYFPSFVSAVAGTIP